ncbi:hypothetical protein ESB00_17850 [Oleiharenicola lentus]|uniref:Uncharacterized protein n=1 Tax=Oleiharenicola lentus TaxID=2508720 RepID=A0A4Q1C5F4_9BACT|nr:hypothetical protein [Oleiharenicola lentus]RXK53555.1 hypothetical protein ESB00_17850 [Oleiharenicola lentus]
MNKLILLLGLIALSRCDASSDYFVLGRKNTELITAFSRNERFSASAEEISFQATINGVQCTLVYRMQDGFSVSALCFVSTQNLKFAEGLKKYSALMQALDSSVSQRVVLRLNGVQLLGERLQLETPFNYIRISGEWNTDYDFEARLDGSFQEGSMETSEVSNLSITISKKMKL